MGTQGLTRFYAAIGAALVAAGAVAAVALAKGMSAPEVSAASNARLATKVLVDAQGRTLYALSSESSRHLLCTSAECARDWPPLTVSTRTARLSAGAGVQGRLALVRRPDGRWQVTLRGMPLYRFAGDRGRDEDNGQGIAAFGGTWHAVTASSAAAPRLAAPSAPAPSEPAPYAAPALEPAPSAPGYPSTGTGTAPSPPSTTPAPPSTTTSTTPPPTYTYPSY